MGPLRATVRNGRLVLDVETTLPEGTVLDLVVDDEGDDLDDAERAALHRSLRIGLEQARRGQTRPASEIIAELRAKRG
jgi:hypothetical protein